MNQLHKLKVNIPEKQAFSYDILIGQNLLSSCDEIIREYTKADKFLVVTNKTVAGLYQKELNISNAKWLILEDGEEHKNLDTLKKILDCAAENKLQRTDCIVAFGGGVAGDIAGFAAAVYMRGVDFVQIPTTLLAQVDSSVGGKTAVNLESGKNLAGAFYQPKVVISDIGVLKTLDLRQLKTGLAEILKYAFIEKSCGAELNYRFLDFLEKNKDEIFNLNPEKLTRVIDICCSLKTAVVCKDETEKGLRAVLNFGHTFAHAIENLTNYTVFTHGEALAAGMKMAFKLSLMKNLTDNDYCVRALKLIDEYQIAPMLPEFDKEKFYDEMFLDKKAKSGKIRFVLPDGFGTVKITSDVSYEQVIQSIDV